MTKLINIHHKVKYDVYIGRSKDSNGLGLWGNPYSHMAGTLAQFKTATREEAIEKYETYIRSRPDLLSRLGELEDRVLGCFCSPKRCHGEVLIKLIEEMKANGTLV